MSAAHEHFQHLVATAPDNLPSFLLGGLDARAFYQLWGSRLLGERNILQLAPGVRIENARLLSGVLRLDCDVKPDWLILGVANADMRILGVRIRAGFLIAGAGGVRMNVIALPPTSLRCLVFEPETAARILADPKRLEGLKRPRGVFGARSLVRFMNPTGRLLFDHARELLAEAEGVSRGDAVQAIPFRLSVDEIIDMSAECVDEMLKDERNVIPDETPDKRIRLAQEVEAMLWRSASPAGPDPLSLDKAAQALGCSRRSVQQAVNEVFGMGFVALKRAIRLHQADALLKEGVQPGEIARIARAYEFNHASRFSQYYREFFGVLPSERGPERPAPGDGGDHSN